MKYYQKAIDGVRIPEFIEKVYETNGVAMDAEMMERAGIG